MHKIRTLRFVAIMVASLFGAANMSAVTFGLWNFDSGNLVATVGTDLSALDGNTTTSTSFGTTTGLGIANISLALAIGQFVWGASQPIFGAIADRWGPARVIAVGAVLLALGSVLTTFVHSQWALIVSLGVLSAAGAGAGSFSILIGATAQRLPAQRRAFASGFINAGGSFGQFVFAPLNRAMIETFSWMHAMWLMAAAALLTAYLLVSAESYLATHAAGVFRMSFLGFGPTELRIILAIGAVKAALSPLVELGSHGRYRLFDLGGVVAVAGLGIAFVAAAIRNTHALYLAEPLPPSTKLPAERFASAPTAVVRAS